jgi:beta-lactamase class D
LAIVILVASCGPKTQSTQPAPEQVTKLPDDETQIAQFFEERGVEGSFLLYDLNKASCVRYNAGRCAQRFLPASLALFAAATVPA